MTDKTQRLLKNLLLALAIAALGWFIKSQGGGEHAAAWSAAGWALTALVVLRVGLALRSGAAKVRAETAKNGFGLKSVDQLTLASMPAWGRGFYATEKRVYAPCWRALTGRPVAAHAQFTVSGGARRRFMLALCLAGVAALGGAGAWWVLGSAMSWLWPAGIGAACVYALLWIAGDHRTLKEGGHSVDSEALVLALGIRAAAVVPLADIAACSCEAPAGAKAQAWIVSPSEAPNAWVELRPGVVINAVRWGYPAELRRHFIALYVDQPAQFSEAIGERLHVRLRAAG